MFGQDSADQNYVVGRVTKPGTVNQVEFIPNWTTAGANTHTRTLTLINGGSGGTATTTLAAMTLTSGINLTRGVAVTMSLGSSALRAVAIGDILRWESVHVSNGVADPGGLVIVQQTFNP
jgi:hypothetical protein